VSSARHESSSHHTESRQISCWSLYRAFFRIGFMTFGGGFSMAAVLRHEIVLKRRWLSEREFLNTLSTATSVPGAVAVNLAFQEGCRLRGLRGGLAAAAGQICPSVLVILFIAQFAVPYFDQPMVAAFLKGAAIAVTGQIAFAATTFARKLRPHWQNALACGLGLAVISLGFHPVWAIVAAACAGYLMMHERMAQRGWTAEDEATLFGRIEGITARGLVGDLSREDMMDIVRRRDLMVKDRFDQVIRECAVLELPHSVSADEFFDLAAAKLAKKLDINATTLASALKKREAEGSTVLNPWLALPHAIIEGEGAFAMLIARAHEGVRFSDQASSVKTIFVLAGSMDERDFYMCSLAAIGQMAGKAEFFEHWFQAKGPQGLKEVVLLAKSTEVC
jgi:chromate transporter